jgi:uncharacterized delta-60 repeat protein
MSDGIKVKTQKALRILLVRRIQGAFFALRDKHHRIHSRNENKMSKRIFIALVLGTVTVSLPAAQGQEVIEAWVARYNGPGNGGDHAHALVLDDSGNVFVTGWSPGSGTGTDYATIKYNADGTELWVARYNGPGNGGDWAVAITLDDSGNVYVTGSSEGSGTGTDYATIKYDPGGTELWVIRYDGPGNGYDNAQALALDESGNVYVTGESEGIGTSNDYATIKYNADGTELWVSRYDGPGNGYDAANAMAVDNSGNVHVTGQSFELLSDYATIKYDPDGNELWVVRYNGLWNSNDDAVAMTVDDSGNVYVTGQSYAIGTLWDYATVKYDTDGNEMWVTHYNGPVNGGDGAAAIALDNSGHVYVTGDSDTGGATACDYATIKYDAAGNELWVARYQGPGIDYANALALDNSGNIYVTGESPGIGTDGDYATIKYDPDGTELWVARYNGPTNSDDSAYALAVDDSGNVYVSGQSTGIGTGGDYATIKYSEITPGIEDDPSSAIPIEFSLKRPYPNPFNPVTTFKLELPVGSWVKLEVFNLGGRAVHEPPLQQWMPAGIHELAFEGASLTSGLYLYRLNAGDFNASGKMVLIK